MIHKIKKQNKYIEAFNCGEKRWHASIRTQIFISIFLITFLVNVVIGNIIKNMSVNTIEENYQRTYKNSLQSYNTIFDMQLNKIIDICRTVLTEESFRDALTNSDFEKKNINYADSSFQILKSISNQISSQDSFITSIAFFDLNGNAYLLNNLSNGSYAFNKHWQTHNYFEEQWAIDAIEARGREVFYGNTILNGVKSSQISFSKYLIDPNTSTPMGFMVVHINQSILQKSFSANNFNYQSEHIYIIDKKLESPIIYTDTESLWDTEIVNNFIHNDEKSPYLFLEYENKPTGWTILHSINKNELSQDSQYIQTIMLFISGITFFFSLIISKLLSDRITKPLNKLEKTIESVGTGERNIQEEFDDSEVGKIGQKFKEMVSNNLELSEKLLNATLKEREAELALLHSQINPHFLYNTLDSLYCMAIIDGNDRIADMVLALSDNFKLTLNNGEKFVSISTALTTAENYIKLQNYRFNNRFSLNITAEQHLLENKVLNFIIQPFVENAIYHGLEPQIGSGKIDIHIVQQNNNIMIKIEDDGVGIKDFKLVDTGFGITNIKERIKLTYGEKYGVTINSIVGTGTTVTIILPLDKEGKLYVYDCCN